jgi:hypothetical protein
MLRTNSGTRHAPRRRSEPLIFRGYAGLIRHPCSRPRLIVPGCALSRGRRAVRDGAESELADMCAASHQHDAIVRGAESI